MDGKQFIYSLRRRILIKHDFVQSSRAMSPSNVEHRQHRPRRFNKCPSSRLSYCGIYANRSQEGFYPPPSKRVASGYFPSPDHRCCRNGHGFYQFLSSLFMGSSLVGCLHALDSYSRGHTHTLAPRRHCWRHVRPGFRNHLDTRWERASIRYDIHGRTFGNSLTK